MGAFQPMHLFVLAVAGIVILFIGALIARLAIPLVRPRPTPAVALRRNEIRELDPGARGPGTE